MTLWHDVYRRFTDLLKKLNLNPGTMVHKLVTELFNLTTTED
jgi:hypothetical protein